MNPGLGGPAGPVPQTFNEGVHSAPPADLGAGDGRTGSPAPMMDADARTASPGPQAAYGGPYPHKQIAIMTSLLFDVLRVVAEGAARITPSLRIACPHPRVANSVPTLLRTDIDTRRRLTTTAGSGQEMKGWRGGT
ncbi:hypothetical protein B0H14DRAFT_3872427 [Mycena olivaceomarginata]|nr:hypothetical protein B0H14DRAFT_3872427 [Mycena olivaceomarginata]